MDSPDPSPSSERPALPGGTAASDLARQSLRAFLALLARRGELTVLEDATEAFDIAACLSLGEAGPALRFEPAGTGSAPDPLPVVGNLLTSLDRIALALGVRPSEVQDAIVAAVAAPLDHRLVERAPCRERLIDRPDLLRELPVPRFFEGEGGPYITAGAIVARDRETGETNLSIARLMPLGADKAFVGVAPNHHLAVLARAAQARGQTLDIAVCIGNHPAVLLAACLYLGLGDDELRVAGALLGEPLAVVETASGLLVPAACECVLEGALDAAEVFVEGAVSEFHGMYETYGAGFVATFSRLTRRHDALFQVILPGYGREHCLLGGVAIAAGLVRRLRALLPNVRAVAVGLGGAGRLHAVVSLEAPRPGAARKAMFAVWAAVNLIKQVTIVDADIDPWDPLKVEWAIATRMKADRDLLVVPAVQADRSEPLDRDGVVAKLGIDATLRRSDRPGFELAKPPDAALRRAAGLLTRRSTPETSA